ncbi:hypothetical protein J7J41_00375 [bacterium]|nr:hypothetical protein [bacterium]
MIQEYHFGEIKINDRIYRYDICLDWRGEVLKWERKESHWVDLKDLEIALKDQPEIIIIGTGAYGIVNISDKVQEKLKNLKIELIIVPTKEAIKIFEEKIKTQKKVVGLFHLTC